MPLGSELLSLKLSPTPKAIEVLLSEIFSGAFFTVIVQVAVLPL